FDLPLLDRVEERPEVPHRGVLPVERGLAEVAQGQRRVEGQPLPLAVGVGPLGLTPQAVALGLVGVGEADVAVRGGHGGLLVRVGDRPWPTLYPDQRSIVNFRCTCPCSTWSIACSRRSCRPARTSATAAGRARRTGSSC